MNTPDADGVLAEQLLRLTRRVHRIQKRHLQQRGLGITPAQSRLLRTLAPYASPPRMADPALQPRRERLVRKEPAMHSHNHKELSRDSSLNRGHDCAAEASNARMSSTRQHVIRPPNGLCGCGKRPVRTPSHHARRETGITGGTGGSARGSPMNCGRRR